MTTIADAPPATPLRQDLGKTRPHRGPGSGVLTPADIASWEADLLERTELCLALGGPGRSKLTVYAGPDATGRPPVAILTGLNGQTYVSRPWNTGVQEWITSILRSAESLTGSP